jgi:RNA polymerase sigma factor (sigma-70 family)
MSGSDRSPVRRDGEPSDWQLLQLSADDPEQFARFYERHVDQILAFLYRRTACAETAADLTSETFAAAFLARRRFRDRGAPARAWLLGIAKHKLAKSARRAKIERRAAERLGLEPPELDDESYARIEELGDMPAVRAALRAALEGLSPALAQAAYLRVGLELPYAEVARRLECSEGAARVRVMRALTQLSDAMEVS